tara:strand:+ start:178 stop:1182 length:1005 start_codon:yes stop_codon:yes gene_type:complete
MIKLGLKKNRKISGPANFIDRLKNEFQSYKDIKIVSNLNITKDISIYNSVSQFPMMKPFILRLDGLYFDSFTQKKNSQFNKKIFSSIEKAEGIIFQSKWCQKLFKENYAILNKQSRIILNGININNKTINTVNKNYDLQNKKIIFTCSGNFRPFKRLQDTINIIIKLKKYVDCELRIIGKNHITSTYPEFIKFFGEVDSGQVLKLLRESHIFIHLSWIDSCPNSVIEAIGNNIPTICNNIGGTQEIVEATNGGIVSKCDNFELVKPLFKDKKILDLNNPPIPDYKIIISDILDLIENYQKFVLNINNSRIDIKNTTKEYYNFLNSILKKKELIL